MSQTSLTEDGYCEPSCKYHFPKTCQYATVCFRWQYGNDSSVERYYFGPNMTYACPLRECMATHAHNMHHSKSKMADGGNWRSRRTEGFHMFRVWNPKTWLGNTKIIEAFVYQLSCGYRTVKSRRQPVKGRPLELCFQIFFWLFSLVATYFVMNGGLTLQEMNDCACSLRGRLLGLFLRIRELVWSVWIANLLFHFEHMTGIDC